MALTRKRTVGIAAVAAAALLAGGGVFWLYGQNDRELARACGGMLAVADVRAVLGDGRLDVETDSGTDRDSCEVTAEGGRSARVEIVDATRTGEPGRRDPLPDLGGPSARGLAVPVGSGWSGLFAAGDDEDGKATVTLSLTCARSSAKTATGKPVTGLVVSVRTELGTTLDDPADRPAYTRIATGTAAKAADAYGCQTRLGAPRIRTVGLPVTWEEYEPLTGTTGTCAGVPTAPGVTTARETARAGAPVERCLLGDDDYADERYTLQALFGPYAARERAYYAERRYDSAPTPADAPKGRLNDDADYWASAACPGDGRERALFLIQRTHPRDAPRPTEAEQAYARQALRAFAERAATAHGCAAPTTP
ncbi:hypothetical protein [Streptomyces griseosporeus]|uniref:hypothetical protein n=1 Tax=Streptomyces griseosporeus TaxID=1910 RepID=UPI0019AC3520|nr:hypothetical protein [Streptomyces griseosporeus]GHF59482.1 hypothetical protein GCM10018783_30390 [Streptomyces griseosporeus]